MSDTVWWQQVFVFTLKNLVLFSVVALRGKFQRVRNVFRIEVSSILDNILLVIDIRKIVRRRKIYKGYIY